MKILIVVGARPNFMKAAPILRAIGDKNRKTNGVITPVLVHTGQHYDATMSDAFFQDLNLPKPDICLGVGSGSHASQTAAIMQKFEGVLETERPDAVVVVGDVNSTLACALVTAKISFDSAGSRPLLAHVEAGLRSFDRSMPEECNRVVTDHLSDFLLVTEESGLRNLQNEGVAAERVFFVGNTMIDSLLAYQEQAENSAILRRLGLSASNGSGAGKPYVLLTLHRPSNVDDRNAFVEILEGLQEIEQTIIFPAHPRTQKQIQHHQLQSYFEAPDGEAHMQPFLATRSAISTANRSATSSAGSSAKIKAIDPLGYLDFLCLMKHACLVITDSGGIQEETTCLGVPCVTVRDNTERPITVSSGSNLLGGTHRDSIREAVCRQQQRERSRSIPELWDGKAAERIIEILLQQQRLRSNTDARMRKSVSPANSPLLSSPNR
jgi:UDP-N-acetylglucosamine 2-epimerase (non-hydrolysing)